MDIKRYFALLKRNKYLLISIPLIAVAVTFFLVRNMADQYISAAQIATGIVDETQQVQLSEVIVQESKINQQFANLIQLILQKKTIDQISYTLILHDLITPDPFRKFSKNVKDLNPDAYKHAVEVYTQKKRDYEPLLLWNADQNGLYKVIESMGYDEESLKKNLSVYRIGSSDFIEVRFTSENPTLSAFVVNELCSEFISSYSSVKRQNQMKGLNFLDSLLRQKQLSMEQKMAQLKNYKIENRVLNLYEQAKSLYGQIADFETKKELAQKDVVAYSGALQSIDEKFDAKDRRYLQSSLTKINSEILATKEQLKRLNLDYIKSNFDRNIQAKIDSLQNLLSLQINTASDKYLYNPLASKENLVQQRLSAEISLDLARNSIESLNAEIKRLNRKFDLLVPHEAVIQSYENDIKIAGEEYMEVLRKYNQANMESKFSLTLRQLDPAMPGDAQPSKKMFLVAASGIVALLFCLVVFFVLFYLDNSIQSAHELVHTTGIPCLGTLPLLHKAQLSDASLWKNNFPETEAFRQSIRAIRFEGETELKGNNNIMAITSLHSQEGKSTLAFHLAKAMEQAHKSVLLIDGNFSRNSLSVSTTPNYFVEDIIATPEKIKCDGFTFIGNRGGDISLFELADEETLRHFFATVRSVCDVVIIDTAALHQLNKAKEWMLFANTIMAVFEYGKTIGANEKMMIQYLKNDDHRFAGWVFNKQKLRSR